MENEEHLGNLLQKDGNLTTASDTGLLEESIKRVVCIVDEKTAAFESTVVTEVVICSSDPEPVLAKESNNEELLDNGPDVKFVDIQNVVAEHKARNGTLIDMGVGTVIAAELAAEKVVPAGDEKVTASSDQSKIASKDAVINNGSGEVQIPMTDGASDSDSEDDLQLIVNDEDIFYPHGIQGGEDAEGEDLFRVAGDEHYDERDWAAEMHYHHSQFKYVRPGSVPATMSPGIQDAAQRPAKAFTPVGRGPMSAYMMGVSQWFEPSYEFVLPPSKTVFDIDLDQFEDKPWDYPGADITDYFNFGFTEESWKQYCEELARLGIEASMKSKMRVYENGHLQQACNLDSSMEFTEALMDTPEPQRILPGRGQGPRRMRRQLSGRAIQVEGGGMERRPSADMRRQRLRDSGSVIQIALQDGGSSENSQKHDNNDEFRRKQRGEDYSTPHVQRRKGFSRQTVHGEQAILPSPLAAGRLGRVPAGPSFVQTSHGGMFPGGMFGPPVGRRPLMYPARPRIPPPIGPQGTLPNGFSHVRHSMDSSDRPWRKFSSAAKRGISGEQPEDEEDRGSYGSSERSRSRESDPDRSEEEYSTTRSRYIESQLTDKRSRRLAEERSEYFITEKRPAKTSRHQATGHVPERVREKKPELVTEERRHLLTEKRSIQLAAENRQQVSEKRSGQPVSEERSVRSGELVSERRSVHLSGNRLATEKMPAQLVTDKRSVQLMSEKRSESSSQEVKTSKTSCVKLDTQPKFKRQDICEKDDLRMKVLERVSARWKLHLRMDDAHAKRKKANLNRAVEEKGQEDVDGANQNSEGGFHGAASKKEVHSYKEEQIEDAETERPESGRARRRKEKREEKKQRHNEKKERQRSRSEIDDKKNYEDLNNHDLAVEKVDERWQMEDAGDTWVEWESAEYDSRSEKGHRKRKRRRKARDGQSDRYEGYLEDGEATKELTTSTHRSSSQHPKARRRHKARVHYDGDDLGAYEDMSFRGHVEGESEEFVHREASDWDEDRWNEDEFAHEDHVHRRTKKRKYHKSNNQHHQDPEGDLVNGYETDSHSQRHNHDGLDENKAEYYSNQSMSSGDEAYYKGRGNSQRCYSKSSYGDSVDRWTGSLYESDEDGYGRYDH